MALLRPESREYHERRVSTALYTTEELTLDSLKKSLPKHLRHYTHESVYQDVLKALNGDGELRRQMGVNIELLKEEDNVRLDDLMHATQFVSMKLSGSDDVEAWKATFPTVYANLVKTDQSFEKVRRKAKRYSSHPLVVKLMEYSIIPAWIQHHSAYHEAVETQLELMRGAKSETVRQKAADSLMTHLAKPEKGVPQVQVNVEESKGLEEIRSMLDSLARNQRGSILEGVSVKDIVEVDVEK